MLRSKGVGNVFYWGTQMLALLASTASSTSGSPAQEKGPGWAHHPFSVKKGKTLKVLCTELCISRSPLHVSMNVQRTLFICNFEAFGILK
jgi:hypothetical protein